MKRVVPVARGCSQMVRAGHIEAVGYRDLGAKKCLIAVILKQESKAGEKHLEGCV